MPHDASRISVANLAGGPPVLSVPAFPRLDEYVGVWAIEPKVGAALWAAASRADVAGHVVSAAKDPPQLKSQTELLPAGKGKQVAVIKVMGTLMKQVPSMTAGTSTVQLRRDVREAANNPDVSGILLAIDSPGGAAAGTFDLAEDVKAANKKKPVYAQIEDMGASAAYWVAAACEAIFANAPTALVGSIGTYMTLYDLSARAEAKGVKALVFATGAMKGAGAEGAPVTEEQAAYFQGIVDKTQVAFDQAVQKGRGLTDKQLADVRSGAVYSAGEAQDRKLIDGVQPLEKTLAALATAGRQREIKAAVELTAVLS